MTRFRFKLEAVLLARKEEERSHQRAVATLERRRRELEDTLRRQQAFISAGKAETADRLVGAIDVSSLRAHAGATIQLMRAAHRLLLELAGIHRRLDAARAELVEAARRRRAIELLRERRLEEWKRGLDKAENAAIDEMAARSAAKREAER